METIIDWFLNNEEKAETNIPVNKLLQSPKKQRCVISSTINMKHKLLTTTFTHQKHEQRNQNTHLKYAMKVSTMQSF